MNNGDLFFLNYAIILRLICWSNLFGILYELHASVFLLEFLFASIGQTIKDGCPGNEDHVNQGKQAD